MKMLNRRQFLSRLGSAPLALPGASLLSSLGAVQANAASTDGYKALVCVFLYGGMDGHDTLIPFDDASWNSFSGIRSTLLDAYAATGSPRDRGNLLALEPSTPASEGRMFALPTEMSGIHSLFNQGKAAVVGNVGPLLAPTNRDQFNANQVPLPARLFSHNDQQSTWMSFSPEGSQIGWGGRFGDAALSAGANNGQVFSQISLGGNVVFLSGDTVQPYQISAEGAPTIGLVDPNGEVSPELQAIMLDHFKSTGANRSSLFESDFVNLSRLSFEANDLLTEALAFAPELDTPFPEGFLAGQLRAVARAISVRETLGVRRQVFFVFLGGFDTHSAQATTLPGLQRQISDAMAAFYSATVELGVEQDVTAFTSSDFGRTLTANGDGTDHGWGSHHFVVGGAVNGGDIYGDVPVADLGHAQDSGNGRLIPGVPVEHFAAPLGRWFGLDQNEVGAALPGLQAFPDLSLEFI